MKVFYCFGKKDFCDRDHRKECDGCEHFDGSGGEKREVESGMTCKDCIHDDVCGCRSHEDEICSFFENRKQSEGEWVKPTMYSEDICSICGKSPKIFLGLLSPYCPNCGAKMKGKTK